MAAPEVAIITSRDDFVTALEYVAAQSAELIGSVLHRTINIDTVCLFAQSAAEYDLIKAWVDQLGVISKLSHHMTQYVEVKQQLAGHAVDLIGVRLPDPDRIERGYGDYTAPDFQAIHETIPSTPALFELTGRPLIEVLDLEYNVRGYIKQKHD